MAEPDALPEPPTTEFPHPYVAVDVVLMTVRATGLHLLTIERVGSEPHGRALPGAFVQLDEDVDDTAARICHEKLELQDVPGFIALRPFGAVARDPRRRVISLPRLALMPDEKAPPKSGAGSAWVKLTDSAGTLQVTVDGTPTDLAFDHHDIVTEAVSEIRRRVELGDSSPYRRLLPAAFTLRQLQEVHEALIGRSVNRDSFRRRLLMSGQLQSTDEQETNVEHRPATLYRWSTASN